MTGLDWLIVVILLLSVLLAAAHGFFFEMFSLGGTVVGYLVAAWEYPRIAHWYLPYVKNQWAADSAAFLTIFIAIVVVAGIAGRIARWAMSEVGLRWFDRLLGGVFGVLRGALIVTVVVMAMAAFGPGSRMLSESRFGSYFLVIGRGAVWVAPSELRTRFRQGLDTLRDLNHSAEGQPSQPATPPAK
jgi:membrane protein required for colicin V production